MKKCNGELCNIRHKCARYDGGVTDHLNPRTVKNPEPIERCEHFVFYRLHNKTKRT